MSRADAEARERQRDYLRTLTWLAEYLEWPFVAVLGLRKGEEIAALADGVRKRCRRLKKYSARRVRVFHRQPSRQVTRVQVFLRSVDGIPRMKRFERMRERRLNRPASRQKPTKALASVPLYAIAAFVGERLWQPQVEKLVVDGYEPFGLVCHLGVGKTINADIHTLDPLIDDRTLICLCHMDQQGPQSHFARLNRDGWSGLELSGIGIMQRRRQAPKE